jgi:hypothetical protein
VKGPHRVRSVMLLFNQIHKGLQTKIKPLIVIAYNLRDRLLVRKYQDEGPV